MPRKTKFVDETSKMGGESAPRRRDRQRQVEDSGGTEQGMRQAKRMKQTGRGTAKSRNEVVAQYASGGKSLEATMAAMPKEHQVKIKQEVIDTTQTKIGDHFPRGDAKDIWVEKKNVKGGRRR